MRYLAALLLLLALTGCGSSHKRSAPAVKPLPAGAIRLAKLPAQGLVVQQAGGVALVGLDGRVVTHVKGFRVYPRNGGTHDFLIQNLDEAGPVATPRLVGPHDRWYRLDAVRHALLPLAQPSIALPGGAQLIAHSSIASDGGVGFDGYTVERRGVVLVPRDRDLRLVQGRLVQTRDTVVDLVTQLHRVIPHGCVAGGVHADAVYAACQLKPKGPPSITLESVGADGSTKTLATIPKLYVDRSSLSPDGRYLATHGSPGCGAGYVFVARTSGGPARLVSGGQLNEESSPYSELLGWSADGRVVVTITTPACDGKIRSGVYLVDPGTLKRTLVTRSAWTMWNPYPVKR